MKRLLWLGVGLAVGAVVVRKVTQKAQRVHPDRHRHARCRNPLAAWSSRCVASWTTSATGWPSGSRRSTQAFAQGELYDDKFAELRDDAQNGRRGGMPQEGQR